MLLRNQDEQTEAKIVRHKTCAWCQRDLDYPRIVAADSAQTSYHVNCALQLANEVTTDVQELLNDPNAADIVKRIEIFNLMTGAKAQPR